MAKQLDIDTIDQLSRYNERRNTRFEYQEEIRVALGLTDFSVGVEAFTVWLDALAFTTGDGPHALFAAAVDYLRGHRVLLPGVSTLARLVAKVRAACFLRQGVSFRLPLTPGNPPDRLTAREVRNPLMRERGWWTWPPPTGRDFYRPSEGNAARQG